MTENDKCANTFSHGRRYGPIYTLSLEDVCSRSVGVNYKRNLHLAQRYLYRSRALIVYPLVKNFIYFFIYKNPYTFYVLTYAFNLTFVSIKINYICDIVDLSIIYDVHNVVVSFVCLYART